MKVQSKSLFLLFLYSNLLININTTIIREAYHFFDVFYYKDIYKNYIKQKKKLKCSVEDGPNCFYIKGKNNSEISTEFQNIFPKNKNILNEKTEDILMQLKAKIQLINNNKEVDINVDDDIFNLDSPYVMQLYLTFESYDELTKLGDIYCPEIIDTQYDIDRITLTILGKLRLSQKNAKRYENQRIQTIKDEGPKNTYAFVESKEVIVKFNSKATVSSVYIKRNSYNIDNRPFYLYGFKNGRRFTMTKLQNVPTDHWIKVNGDGKKYDGIGLLRGFDYDNLVINAALNPEGLSNLSKYTKQYSSVLSEKINGALIDVINKMKTEDSKTKTGKIKVLTIDLNQNDIMQNVEQEENFDIPEELLKEIDNNNENRQSNNKKEDSRYKNNKAEPKKPQNAILQDL